MLGCISVWRHPRLGDGSSAAPCHALVAGQHRLSLAPPPRSPKYVGQRCAPPPAGQRQLGQGRCRRATAQPDRPSARWVAWRREGSARSRTAASSSGSIRSRVRLEGAASGSLLARRWDLRRLMAGSSTVAAQRLAASAAGHRDGHMDGKARPAPRAQAAIAAACSPSTSRRRLSTASERIWQTREGVTPSIAAISRRGSSS